MTITILPWTVFLAGFLLGFSYLAIFAWGRIRGVNDCLDSMRDNWPAGREV